MPPGSDQVITLTLTWPVISGPARRNTIDTGHKYPYLLQNQSRAGDGVVCVWGGGGLCVCVGGGAGRRGWGCIHL